MGYWISDNFISIFEKGISIDENSDFTGSQNKTADNEKYIKLFWEVPFNKMGKNKKWISYAKGGKFRKYYGNNEYVVDWSSEAKRFYKNNQTSNLIDDKYCYEERITFTKVTTKFPNFRYLTNEGTFDMGGASIVKVKKLFYCLALLNSNIAHKVFNILNPTINLQNKDVKAFPLIFTSDEHILHQVEEKSKKCVDYSKTDWDSFETSWDFKKHPLV